MTITATTSKDGSIKITVAIGDRAETMTLSEWSKAIANPIIEENK